MEVGGKQEKRSIIVVGFNWFFVLFVVLSGSFAWVGGGQIRSSRKHCLALQRVQGRCVENCYDIRLI